MVFTSPWTWTLTSARTMRFSPHTVDWKLTLVQISERCRLTWHEQDQRKMTPPSWPVSSVRKAVRRTELSLSLSSVYFGWWFKIIFCRLHGSYFVVELQVQSTLFCFSVNSKLRTKLNSRRWIISARVSVSLRLLCFVAVTVFTTSSVFTFPWSPCF